MTTDIKTIIVPIDFSANSARALDYAKMLAQRFGAAIHLVHVCEVPSMATASMDAYAIAYSDWSQRLGDEAEHELVRVAAGVHGVETSTEILFGHPARCIIAAATANEADLIVMGTHGHGPVMHVVMGSVAERVVRTSPCPVLTVREPRAIEWHKPHHAKAGAGAAAVAAAMLLAMLMAPPAATRAGAQTTAQPASAELLQRVAGRDVFRTYCVTCHGQSAKGDGPLAKAMQRKPADLTEIAKRNDGVFPAEIVFQTIDGRKKVKGHGGPDMPEWADAFARSRQSGDATAIKDTIDSLVRYIESLQVKSTP